MKFLIVSRTFSSVSIAWTGEPGGRTNSHCPGVALACRCSTVMPTSVNARTTCSIRSKRSKSSSVIQDHEWDWLNGIYVIVPLLCHLGFINTTSTTKPINGEKKKSIPCFGLERKIPEPRARTRFHRLLVIFNTITLYNYTNRAEPYLAIRGIEIWAETE